MEFEYTGVVYIDTDDIFERCINEKAFTSTQIYTVVGDYISTFDDVDYYHVEGWMIDKVVTEIKKRVDKVRED